MGIIIKERRKNNLSKQNKEKILLKIQKKFVKIVDKWGANELKYMSANQENT